MSERTRGVIIRDITHRGFGFVRDSKTREHFFHYSDCKDFTPELGMEVTFEIGHDKMNRTKAINLERASEVTSGTGS